MRGEIARQRAYVTNEHATGNVLVQRHQATHLQRLRRTPEGVFHVVQDPREAPHAVLVLPRVPAPGAQWTIESELRLVESRTFAAEDRLLGRRLPLILTARIEAMDARVRTPAGEFTDCVHVTYKGTRKVPADRGTLLVDVTVRHAAWYAPGIGLVRMERHETTDSTFLRDGHYTQALLAYGIP